MSNIVAEPDHHTGPRVRKRSAVPFVVACARRILLPNSWRSARSKPVPRARPEEVEHEIAPPLESTSSSGSGVEVSIKVPGQVSIIAGAESLASSDLRLTPYDSAARAGVENLRIRSQVLRSIG